MKRYTFIFLLLHTLCSLGTVTAQTSLPSLIGTWTVTDYKNAPKHRSVWQFQADSSFNELKPVEGSKTNNLEADESGTWKQFNDTLTIVLTSEMNGDERLSFSSPQVLAFILKEHKEGLLLYHLEERPQDLLTAKTVLLKRKP